MPLLLRKRDLRSTPCHIPLCKFDSLFSLSSRNFKFGMVANVPEAISGSLQPPNHKYSTARRPWNISGLISASSVWSNLNVPKLDSCENEPSSILVIGLWYDWIVIQWELFEGKNLSEHFCLKSWQVVVLNTYSWNSRKSWKGTRGNLTDLVVVQEEKPQRSKPFPHVSSDNCQLVVF